MTEISEQDKQFLLSAGQAALEWGRTGNLPEGFTGTDEQVILWLREVENTYEEACGEDESLFTVLVQKSVFLLHGLADQGIRISPRSWTYLTDLEGLANIHGYCDAAVEAIRQWMHVTGRHLNQDYIIAGMAHPMTWYDLDLLDLIAIMRRESLEK